jgi:hypothetical protein
MAAADIDRSQLNRQIDRMISRIVAGKPISREFTAELVNTASLCRRVAEFDPQLASELLLSAIMLSYTTGVAIIKRH